MDAAHLDTFRRRRTTRSSCGAKTHAHGAPSDALWIFFDVEFREFFFLSCTRSPVDTVSARLHREWVVIGTGGGHCDWLRRRLDTVAGPVLVWTQKKIPFFSLFFRREKSRQKIRLLPSLFLCPNWFCTRCTCYLFSIFVPGAWCTVSCRHHINCFSWPSKWN